MTRLRCLDCQDGRHCRHRGYVPAGTILAPCRCLDCDPKPIQTLPEIWVGGGGEKVTLRIEAKHADKTNWQTGIEGFVRKSGLLEQYCGEIGRDFVERRTRFVVEPREDATVGIEREGHRIPEAERRLFMPHGIPQMAQQRLDDISFLDRLPSAP